MDLVLVSLTTMSLVVAVSMGGVLFRVLREERRRSDARVALLTSAAGYASPVRADTLPETSSPAGRRTAAIAAIALLVTAAGYTLLSRADGSSSGQADHSLRAPLELVALRHAQEGNGLSISGVVQNPRTGRAISSAAAIATVFDPQGTLLGVGRSRLDYAVLTPGAESPFVIKVAVSGTASRYRVSFRGPDGAVIAHVDRRADGAAARHDASSGSEPWVR